MPIYEYEAVDFECLICQGRFEAIQAVNDAPYEFCPTCGLPVRRLISKASIKVAKGSTAEKAGKKGLTTFKRAQKGVWERVGGEGVDVIQGTPEDVAALEAEKKPKRVLDLDKKEGG